MEGFGCADDFYKGMKKAVPDLVLLDVMLPGEDGLSILKDQRAGSKYTDYHDDS